MAIIFIKDKDLSKNAEKLVEYNNYLFIDGTEEGGDSRLQKFANVTSFDIFNPPVKALKDDSIVDGSSAKTKKAMMNHISDKEFKKALKAIGHTLSNDVNLNIFIALKSKVYKKYAKFYCKQFKKFYKTDDFVYTYDDAKKDKKILKKAIKKSVISDIKDVLKKKKKKK